ncbi:Protein KTI12 homolog [Linum perenne]
MTDLCPKDSIIIVDSLNSIKGYRYELWCLARATGIRYCVVFCDVEGNQCQQWNEGRKEKGEAAYDDAIFDDLARRFERPDSRNRWDSPLFELHPSRDGIEKSSPAIVDAVSATQEVTSVIVEAQSQALGGPMNGISIGQDLPTLNVSKSVGLPELRRLRRTFMKLTGQTSLSGRPPPSDAESAKRMFVDYLNRELDTA